MIQSRPFYIIQTDFNIPKKYKWWGIEMIFVVKIKSISYLYIIRFAINLYKKSGEYFGE